MKSKKGNQFQFSYKEAKSKLTKENIIDFMVEIADAVKLADPSYSFGYAPLPKDWNILLELKKGGRDNGCAK